MKFLSYITLFFYIGGFVESTLEKRERPRFSTTLFIGHDGSSTPNLPHLSNGAISGGLPHPAGDMQNMENERAIDSHGSDPLSGAPEVDEIQDSLEEAESRQLPLLGDLFMDRFTDLVHHDNVQDIREKQCQMLHILELSNSKLGSLNDISERTFEQNVVDFRHHIKMLQDMKKQLDFIFRRIRSLKGRVALAYPQAYAAAVEKCSINSEDYEDS